MAIQVKQRFFPEKLYLTPIYPFLREQRILHIDTYRKRRITSREWEKMIKKDGNWNDRLEKTKKKMCRQRNVKEKGEMQKRGKEEAWSGGGS